MECCRFGIAHSNAAKTKKGTLYGSFRNLRLMPRSQLLKTCCLVRGLGVDDRGNLPQAG